jgi:hypothetical protein
MQRICSHNPSRRGIAISTYALKLLEIVCLPDDEE